MISHVGALSGSESKLVGTSDRKDLMTIVPANKIDLVDTYHRSHNSKHIWPAEVARRADGLNVRITPDFFFHMNPIYEPNLAMRYVVGRYEAAYDALARLRPKSVLEIGCAQGLSTWLMTSWAERVVGLDILEDRTQIGRHLFPEMEFVTGDWREYLARGVRFDVIVNSHGPVISAPEIDAACDHYIYIGYRTHSWRESLSGGHKIQGQQLSFSTTISGKAEAEVARHYMRYFMRRNWLKEARHAVSNGYTIPF